MSDADEFRTRGKGHLCRVVIAASTNIAAVRAFRTRLEEIHRVVTCPAMLGIMLWVVVYATLPVDNAYA